MRILITNLQLDHRTGTEIVVRDLALYPAVDALGPDSVLTVRDLPQQARLSPLRPPLPLHR